MLAMLLKSRVASSALAEAAVVTASRDSERDFRRVVDASPPAGTGAGGLGGMPARGGSEVTSIRDSR